MNNERKSVFITLSIIIVLSGLITLGIALTITMFSLFIVSVIEMKR